MNKKVFFVFVLMLLVSACDGGNSQANNVPTVSPPLATIAFKEEELKDVVWITPAILTKTTDTAVEYDIRFSIMIFDGDDFFLVTPETGDVDRFKWKLGDKGQILLASAVIIDPLSDDEPEFEFNKNDAIWKVKDDQEGFKIRADMFDYQKSDIALLKSLPLNSGMFSGVAIQSFGRVIGQFEGANYRYIPGSNLPDYFGVVSNDRFQNTVLVKGEENSGAQRYMLFEGKNPRRGTLLRFSYSHVDANFSHKILIGMSRIKNLIIDEFLMPAGSSSPTWSDQAYK